MPLSKERMCRVMIRLHCPIDDPADLLTLSAGTPVLLSGTVITARDAAHERLVQLIARREVLPVDMTNQVVYYVGPAPAPPGHVIGSAGPTTASRMDKWTPTLLSLGLKGMIGKGYRSEDVRSALIQYHAIYFGAIGGIGALLSQCITVQRLVAFPELGPEAIYELTIHDFPVVVLIDTVGRNYYDDGQKAHRCRS